jgi:hypothetical protein
MHACEMIVTARSSPSRRQASVKTANTLPPHSRIAAWAPTVGARSTTTRRRAVQRQIIHGRSTQPHVTAAVSACGLRCSDTANGRKSPNVSAVPRYRKAAASGGLPPPTVLHHARVAAALAAWMNSLPILQPTFRYENEGGALSSTVPIVTPHRPSAPAVCGIQIPQTVTIAKSFCG